MPRRCALSDGGVRRGIFAFGAVPFWASTGSLRLVAPVVAMDPTTPPGLLVGGIGCGVFSFDSPFLGTG